MADLSHTKTDLLHFTSLILQIQQWHRAIVEWALAYFQ